MIFLVVAGCATGGADGDPDGMDAGGEDAATTRRDGGRTTTYDARIRLPDTGTGGDSGFVTACESAADGMPCDADRDGCTAGDQCSGGVCIPGPREACDDGMSCTSDRCVSTGVTTFRCENEAATSTCTIDGACFANGATNPANPCQRCNASTSPSAWTTQSGAACDDGSTCTSNDVCSAEGICGGTGSGDRYEPNDARTAAHPLGNISDGDNFPSGTIRPTLFPDGDEDWFRYHDSDDAGGLIYPRVDLRSIPAGSDYELCAYFDCDNAFESLSCESGTASSRDGLQGCCSTAGGSDNESVRLNPDCSSTDDSGVVYVRVWRFSGAPTCETYDLLWGDD